MMMKSEFIAAFQHYWTQSLRRPWTAEVAQSCLNPKAAVTEQARATFLDSQIGIGVDVFFGGGGFDFQIQADVGTLVAESKTATPERRAEIQQELVAKLAPFSDNPAYTALLERKGIIPGDA